MARIIIADKIYIPKNRVDLANVKKHYSKRVYNEAACGPCKNKPDRFNDICAACPSYKGHFVTWHTQEIKNRDYIALPKGNWGQIRDRLGINLYKEDLDDRRSKTKAAYPLTFTKKLYRGTETINGVLQANQVAVVKKFWNHPNKSGIIKARPGTGKTVMAVRLLCAFGRRAIIVTNERELLRQFLRTLRKSTNLKEMEETAGRKLAGIIQKDSDWAENWDTVLVTYQKFIRPTTGMRRIKKYVLGKFGLFGVDEVHRANALTYSKFANLVDCKYLLGLTAETKRKDGMEFLVEQILGPVVSEAVSSAMVPTVFVHPTGHSLKYEWKGQSGYTKICRWLSENKDRNAAMVKQVFADLRKNPKNSIVIPVLFVDHAKKLVELISKQAAYNNKHRNEDWPENLADTLLGSGQQSAHNQDIVLKATRNGETRVIVATRKKVAEGIDVPNWTHMYMQFPMNNAPQFYQLTQRICRAIPDKPQPVLRFYVDNIGLVKGCFTSTWFNGVVVNKYIVPPEEYKNALTLIKKESQINISGGFSLKDGF